MQQENLEKLSLNFKFFKLFLIKKKKFPKKNKS